jgi:hypothetical protein
MWVLPEIASRYWSRYFMARNSTGLEELLGDTRLLWAPHKLQVTVVPCVMWHVVGSSTRRTELLLAIAFPAG